MNKKLFFLLIFQIQIFCTSDLYVFNVGQGNCNLFAPKGTGAFIPVLYDAGSTKFPTTTSGEKLNKIEVVKEISTKIKSVASYKILNIVISHGDTDHYSYILDIMKDLGVPYKFRLFLGGKKTDYAASFMKELKKIPAPRCTFYYAEELSSMPNPEISTEYTGQFLSSCVYEDKNASSLVFKIAQSSSISASVPPLVLFTGDATNTTTDPIAENDVKDTRILIANHHGSNTHGSNNKAWIDKTQPEVVVFSAKESSHEHPHNNVVSLYHNSPRISNEDIHEFSYSGDRIAKSDTFATYYQYSSGTHHHYRALVRKAMFNTMNEGTMRFVLPSITPRPDKPFFSMFPLKNLTTLDLSDIKMINEELVIILPKLHILSLLKDLHLNNNTLSLAESADKGKESVEAISCFLQNITSLDKIYLWDQIQIDNSYLESTINESSLFSKLRLQNLGASSI